MLTIATKLKPSSIAGIGLFSDEKLKKGTLVWKNNVGSELIIDQSEFEKKSSYIQNLFKNYGYKNKANGEWRLPLDDSRFMNHSSIPNIVENEAGDYIAICDIEINEEITCNYHEFDEGKGNFKF